MFQARNSLATIRAPSPRRVLRVTAPPRGRSRVTLLSIVSDNKRAACAVAEEFTVPQTAVPEPGPTRRRFRLSPVPAILAVLSLVATTVALGVLRPAAATEVTDGLAVWYKMDETSGAVAADSSGNGRNG